MRMHITFAHPFFKSQIKLSYPKHYLLSWVEIGPKVLVGPLSKESPGDLSATNFNVILSIQRKYISWVKV